MENRQVGGPHLATTARSSFVPEEGLLPETAPLSTPSSLAALPAGGMVRATNSADNRLTPINNDIVDDMESVISKDTYPRCDDEAPGLSEEVVSSRPWCGDERLGGGDFIPRNHTETEFGESVRSTGMECQETLTECSPSPPQCDVSFVILYAWVHFLGGHTCCAQGFFMGPASRILTLAKWI